MRAGAWGVPFGTSLSPGEPKLLSVGVGTMGVGLLSIWVGHKMPCIIISECCYIVISDVRPFTPLYSPCFESLPGMCFGPFEFYLNASLERCYIVAQKSGSVQALGQQEVRETIRISHMWARCILYAIARR